MLRRAAPSAGRRAADACVYVFTAGGFRAAAAAAGVVVEEVRGKAGAENLLLIGNRTREREGFASCAHGKDFTKPVRAAYIARPLHLLQCRALGFRL